MEEVAGRGKVSVSKLFEVLLLKTPNHRKKKKRRKTKMVDLVNRYERTRKWGFHKQKEGNYSISQVMSSKVKVNEYGQPISKNCTSIGHRKGALICTHVPVSYTDWKNDVWNNLKEEYDLPETSKGITVKSMAGPWRRFKHELRINHYDKYPTHEQMIEHIPPKVKKENWITFCENESKELAERSRIEHKRKRENLSYSHCSGRQRLSFVKAELEAANLEEEISSEDVWLKAHTQAGGAILASAMPFDDLLKKTQEAIKEKQDVGLPVKDPCALTAAFGQNTRGRVRSLGPISRLQVEHSAPTNAKVKELKAKEGGLNKRVEELGGMVELLIEIVGTLCNTVKDMQASRAPSVVGSNANVPSGSQDLGGSTQSGSHAQTNSPVGPLVSPAQSRIGGMQRCTLLNMDGEIIAIGRLCTGALGRMCHSLVVPPTHAKVVLDEIRMPLQVTAKANMLASHFKDVGVGGYVLHSKMLITYD